MKKLKRTPKKTTNRKLNTKNSRILRDTMVTLGALKEQTKLNNLPIHEIQMHLLDKDGDGIVLCLEYDERNGELNKTFYNTEEMYDEEFVEAELEESLDPCISPENVAVRFEEVISEEYEEALSEIFHNSNDGKSSLLN